MNPQTSPLLRWLFPVGLGVFLIASAAVSSAQDSAARVLTLQEALDIAVESSPTMIRQKMNLERQYLNLKASEAALKARFSLSLNPYNYTRRTEYNDFWGEWYNSETQSSSVSFNVTQPVIWSDGTLSLRNNLNYSNSDNDRPDSKESTTYQSGVTLSYSQPLFTYNQQKMDFEELQMDVRNTELSYISQMLSIERSITQSYYNLYRAKNNLEIAKEDYQRSLDNYNITVNKVEAGLLPQFELSQAEVTKLNSELSYEDEVQSFEDTKDSFKLTLGLPLEEDFDIELNIVHTPVEVDAEFAVSQALANNISLIQTDISLKQSENTIIRTKSQNEFSGSVDLSYGLTSTEESMGDLFKSPVKNQTVGLGVEIPIFDWGVADARIRSSEISHESSLISAEDEHKQLIISIRQACRNLDKLLRTYEIAQQSAANAQITYEISAARYANGDLSAMELQQQQQQLTQAQQSVTTALLNYKMEILSLKSETLYDFETGQPVDTEALLAEGN